MSVLRGGVGVGGGGSLILKDVSSSAEGRRSESWCVNKVQTKDGKCPIVELEKQHGEFMKSL